MAIILAKGGEINLTKAAAALTQYKFGLSWDKDADLDAVAILLGEDGKILPPDDGHISYYGNCTKNKFKNPENPVAGLVHSGDARNGAAEGDDETITIDTTKVSDKVKAILLAVTSYSDGDAVPFAAAAAPVAKLYNDKDQALFEIKLDENAAFSTCVEFIKLARTAEGWVVTNLTNPIGASNKNGLTDLLAAYQ
ncbi:TerD family protein [Herbiconiux daphne]|uniref:TerD family protein n=1 Tax=Herbiconiux daphne TaxID=2970914 RepID=A0ABT2H9W9_9MICO|nr:TerD family protein [Herbiconiux daphne]MCS5736732.1 TerD family protein [Herbiconiux daphne]